MAMLLERLMPTAALDEYLASDEKLLPLVGTLKPGTDSDLLIDLIKDAKRADAHYQTISLITYLIISIYLITRL